MTIISSDLVPVDAQTVDSVFLGVGRRIDVTIDALQPVNNYWINATLSSSGLCGGPVNPFPAAILRYAGAPSGLPANQGVLPADTQTGCMDLPNLAPIATRTAPVQAFVSTYNSGNILPVELETTGPASGLPLFRWRVNGTFRTQIDVDLGSPVTHSTSCKECQCRGITTPLPSTGCQTRHVTVCKLQKG
jgi:FtsP/CotA-like multicopper oxidase with cupredoxin domain